MKEKFQDAPVKVTKNQVKSNSDVYEIYLGTFIDNAFTWYSIKKFKDPTAAYKEFKNYVNTQLKYTDEELKQVWDTGRLDIELRQGNKLLNWVGIYSREVKPLTKKEEKEATKGEIKKDKKNSKKDSYPTNFREYASKVFLKDDTLNYEIADYPDVYPNETVVIYGTINTNDDNEDFVQVDHTFTFDTNEIQFDDDRNIRKIFKGFATLSEIKLTDWLDKEITVDEASEILKCSKEEFNSFLNTLNEKLIKEAQTALLNDFDFDKYIDELELDQYSIYYDDKYDIEEDKD